VASAAVQCIGLAHDLNRRPAPATGEIEGRPLCVASSLFSDGRVVLHFDESARRSFQAVDERRHRNLRQVVDQQRLTVVLAVEYNEFRLEVRAHACEDHRQVIEDRLRENRDGISP
jgi:hypothetical protein